MLDLETRRNKTPSDASRVLVADIVLNELRHAQTKLPAFAGRVEYLEENATAMSLASRSVDANVIFFLLHELPHHLEGMEDLTCERRTVFFGNFHVIVATRALTA